jgi:hypothetical protein
MRHGAGGWAALITAMVLVGSGGMATAEPPAVFSPIPRVVCDRKGWACYDAYGPSVPITRAHLGDKAAGILQARLAKASNRRQPERFVLSNGTECWIERRVCFTREGGDQVEPMTTRALFGHLQ